MTGCDSDQFTMTGCGSDQFTVTGCDSDQFTVTGCDGDQFSVTGCDRVDSDPPLLAVRAIVSANPLLTYASMLVAG